MNMEKCYAFAGVELSVWMPDDWNYDGQRILAPYEVQETKNPIRFRFSFFDTPEPPQGKLVTQNAVFCVYEEGDIAVRYLFDGGCTWERTYARILRRGTEYDVALKKERFIAGLTDKTLLNCLGAEHLVVQAGGVVFHSSFIRHQDAGILFTAPSGVGKSTQAELWEKLRGAVIVNGDRSAIRMADNAAFACGIPFAGSSPFCKNETLPLKAIVYLKQAPVTTIRRLRGAEAFRRVWEGCSINVWDRRDMTLASGTVLQVLNAVPVYELACTPDESAVLALEGVLKG